MHCDSIISPVIITIIDQLTFVFRLAWKFVKLMEVSVSPDPDNAHVSGSVALVKDG